MKLRNIIFGLFGLICALSLILITWIDREPYRDKAFYRSMMNRLDSLDAVFPSLSMTDPLQVGWAEVDITPDSVLPLAGYGARDPKALTGIHDRIGVRSFVFRQGDVKVCLFSADLLIVHPELTGVILKKLSAEGWNGNEIYFSATHSHSSIGAWAPGFVGNLFAGDFNPNTVEWLADRFIESLRKAQAAISTTSLAYGELSIDDLVQNRLVGDDGDIDPWLKTIILRNQNQNAVLATFSAHATCLKRSFTEVSGDYPAAFMMALEKDTSIFASFSAGAVGSMGTGKTGQFKNWEKAEFIGETLSDQVNILRLLNPNYRESMPIRSFRMKLDHREPALKISQNLVIRPWVFDQFVGSYTNYVSVFQLGDILLVGMPCDFSGELALPLYDYARSQGLNLVLTSFNGGYMGYVIKDEWYDLEKYESRTMSWYGPDTGSYFSEIVKRIIDGIARNN